MKNRSFLSSSGIMSSSTPINILCATDNGYAPYCGVMLTSLLENNRDCELRVFVFVDEGFSSVNRKKFVGLASRYGCSIIVRTVDDSLIEGFPVYKTSHVITLPTYYRLLAAKLLPEDVRRVIYLDCDIIVRGSLKPLWEMDMERKVIAGVKDSGIHFREWLFEKLGYPTSWGYFNAGVLLIDLEVWRTQGIDQQIYSFIKENGHLLSYMDQDALNGVLFERKLFILERFNLQTVSLLRKVWSLYPEAYRVSLLTEKQDAIVIHYSDIAKPWSLMNIGIPFQSEWDKYRKISGWNCPIDIRPIKKSLKQWVKRNLFPNLWKEQLNMTWVTS